MPEDKRASAVMERFHQLESTRRPYEQNWQAIRDLVRPGTSDFNRASSPGRGRTDLIFDGTAPKANGRLAAALIGYMASPAIRWFNVEIQGIQHDDIADSIPEDALKWLDLVSEAIYEAYSDERSNFNSTMHELFQDLGAFGTCVPSQEWDADQQCLAFKAHALGSCYIQENCRGMVDTVFRLLNYTTRQMHQEYKDLPRQVMEEKNPDKSWRVLHSVFPREDAGFMKMAPQKMTFASLWTCLDTKSVLKESGYRQMPYHVARWVKLAEEIYGRGPAIDCLPDIRMLNQMERVLLKAGQKAVDPPLQVPDDGFLLPIKTSPGSLIFKDPSAPEIIPLEHKGNLPFGLDQANQKREHIEQCFHSDWIKMEKENVEMTAYEVQDRRDEKLRLLSPMFGRIMVELLSPMISRSFNLLKDNGRLPPAPGSLSNRKLTVYYTSPAARAQRMVKSMGMDEYIQGLIPMAQLNPQVMDVVDLDAYARQKALLMGTSRLMLRSKAEIDKIRADRNQQQEIQAATQVAEPVTKSLKNLADAKKNGLNLGALMQ